jgi:hypothetical protein
MKDPQKKGRGECIFAHISPILAHSPVYTPNPKLPGQRLIQL